MTLGHGALKVAMSREDFQQHGEEDRDLATGDGKGCALLEFRLKGRESGEVRATGYIGVCERSNGDGMGSRLIKDPFGGDVSGLVPEIDQVRLSDWDDLPRAELEGILERMRTETALAAWDASAQVLLRAQAYLEKLLERGEK